ncbi:hypothetical protein B0T22DRAFT_126983 [Podospora appendiculata]|uniref:Uncharacterized protein n=1 Tax=Podospora appendiculata TaxID=314037 RepID=A0AAE0X7R0_9PEZI|nr:hypothetical protein B0T22DRAFT_126983 [Podospora appendiculata]
MLDPAARKEQQTLSLTSICLQVGAALAARLAIKNYREEQGEVVVEPGVNGVAVSQDDHAEINRRYLSMNPLPIPPMSTVPRPVPMPMPRPTLAPAPAPSHVNLGSFAHFRPEPDPGPGPDHSSVHPRKRRRRYGPGPLFGNSHHQPTGPGARVYVTDDHHNAYDATLPEPEPEPNSELFVGPSTTPCQPAHPSRASSGYSFMHFPGEIRNIIYDYALDYPSSLELYAPYKQRIDEFYARRNKGIIEDFPQFSGKLRAPTILLLCRAITAECLPILQSRRLVIDRLPPWLPGHVRPMPICRFIGIRTLQSVKNLEIRIPLGHGSLGSGWVWSDIAGGVFDILQESNSFEHLRVIITIFNRGLRDYRYFTQINQSLATLGKQNPNVWTPGRIEREYWVCFHSCIIQLPIVLCLPLCSVYVPLCTKPRNPSGQN